ncbi:Crp/Fnr family transcriptional regulator [Qipengyuania sp. G39]|uniref:Crp/Fnr family transcriptional regulator n=1 Tax=Qipengyuania profundimaris TaxID=3067652 RepID=A0ABT9HRA9_9SPHN|nr:Crp/Fnr family transcriptional regulator [Qipengyuania sp. G39]MDP4575692.1 Crp/Fnr family transcriptional regulator [Qipengyuania sp. G39]
MSTPLERRLSCFTDLDENDRAILTGLCSDVRTLSAEDDLIEESAPPKQVFIQLEGWAFRYKLLPEGKRQITGYLLPGDICDPFVFVLKRMDHGIGALSDLKCAAVSKDQILEAFNSSPRIARGLWWSSLVDESILRQWLTNLGQRFAYERMAHIFCELWLRMTIVGLADEDEFHLPLTQNQLGDTIGLTPVHVNRTLQRMRSESLIEFEQRRLKICDIDKLKDIAEFNSDYLHLERR